MLRLNKVITSLIVFLAFTAITQAEIICKKDGRYWYPANDKAIKIAKMLKVKTCNGKRFKSVVAGLGEKSNVTTTKKYSVKDIIKSLKK